MKKSLLFLAFITPLLSTLSAIVYILGFEERSEGVVVGLGILIIIATLECLAYGILFINWLNEKLEKKYVESLEVSN